MSTSKPAIEPDMADLQRFQYHSKKLVEFGLKCGLAIKSMEDSIREELLEQLSKYATTNTRMANLLSWHEKTVRTLKVRYMNMDEVLQQNRLWNVASIIYDLTHSDPNKWVLADSIHNHYIDRNAYDTTFTSAVLEDVIEALILQDHVIAQITSYQSFYRLNPESLFFKKRR